MGDESQLTCTMLIHLLRVLKACLVYVAHPWLKQQEKSVQVSQVLMAIPTVRVGANLPKTHSSVSEIITRSQRSLPSPPNPKDDHEDGDECKSPL